METILRDYGPVGFLVYVIWREFMPWARKRLDKNYDNEAKLKEAELARDAAREERMVKAMESMAESVNAIHRLLAAMDVRVAQIERNMGLPEPEQVEQPTQPRRRKAQ